MATANIANTKVVPTETTALPYYDDFDESKNFHRILFRPGYAVQARELTQLQTILQNQIERFGNHIFKNGSIVLGGQLSVDTKAKYINLVSTYANTDVTAAVFKSNNITYTSGNSAVIAYVSATAEATNTAPPVLMVKYLSGKEFPNNTTLMSNVGYYANVTTGVHTGKGSLVSISDSIFFINGYFVKVPSQTIVLDRFTTRANAKVGLEFTDAIVDETSDTSLLDPAQEASNYQAPGATRLKIDFSLTTRSLDSVDDEKFVELLRIQNGAIKKMVRYPVYSELGDTMARRTFDESGNYTVRRFRATVNDHPTDNTKFQITLDPGKAYVKGYEYESIAQVSLDVDRARANASVSNRELTINYGNNLYIENLKGYFDVASMQNVDFYNTNTGIFASGSKIGSGRIRTIDYYTASNTRNLATSTYVVSLFYTSFTGANSLAYANSIATTTGNGVVSILSKNNGQSNGTTIISDPTFSTLVYNIGDNFIVPSTITDQNYSYLKQADITFTAGSATIPTAIGESFVGVTDGTGISSSTLENFIVFRTNGTRVDLTSVTVASDATLTSDTFTAGTAKVFYKVYLNSIAAKTKTLVTANTTHFSTHAANNTFVAGGTTTKLYGGSGQVLITAPSLVPGTKMSLFYSDVNQIRKIYDLNGAAAPAAGASLSSYADVTNKYIFYNGQRDALYDHANIALAPRLGTPKGPLVVCFNWFQHSAAYDGYFSVDSYPNIDYGNIPSYTSTDGTTYSLRDCIDFRPKRVNESNTNENFIITGDKIPVSGTSFSFDYKYYLARRSFALITKQGDLPFKILDGDPAKYPVDPRPDDESMILYKMYIEPYTASTKNVNVQYVENKRYTMRDIGKLETRIENLEYYQTLSILEKSTKDMSIVDTNGLERTKYGIIADNFSTHGYGDVLNPDYFIAMDRLYGSATPPQKSEFMPLYKQATSSTKQIGSTITLNYTEEEFVTQNLATKWVPVQPYMLSQWVGQVDLTPESDIWVETNEVPDIIINLGENDALSVAAALDQTTRQAQLRAANPMITESFSHSTQFGSTS